MQPHRRAAASRERFQTLSGTEALIVSALRLWVEPLREPERRHPHWQDGLVEAGLSNDAAVAFDTLLRITLAAANRPLDLHRPPCPALGIDEVLLLDMLRLAQQGAHGEAGILMSDWLPLPGVRMAMAPLCILASALARAGLVLPDPAVDTVPESNREAGRPGQGRQVRTMRHAATPTPMVDPGGTLVH
ncbi:hypothetical protein AZL_a10080 (plasmid) [Azospirillum sp. B510]|uniref:hypothetical protein n=1 Tax=Azospirillum sp. (strain B510) TaxID=137722 RepID=UPI0001C4BCD0|nr:hypothetical protein [Azospirillum sp. B510]BAI74539.1 hypothetical protein AZL_a10080 [Azospirillum sp. B510]